MNIGAAIQASTGSNGACAVPSSPTVQPVARMKPTIRISPVRAEPRCAPPEDNA